MTAGTIDATDDQTADKAAHLAAEAVRRLKALRAGETAGWYTIVGGDPSAGVASRWLLRLPAGTLRELYRDEVLPWFTAFTDSLARPDVLDALTVDELVTLQQAADILGRTLDAVKLRTKTRATRGAITRPSALYPIHLDRHLERRLLRVQVEASLPTTDLFRAARRGDTDAAAELQRRLEVRAEWDALREQYPFYERLDTIDYDPPISPNPLPVPPLSYSVNDADRRVIALDLAGDRRLLRYLFHDPDTSEYAVRAITAAGHDGALRRLAPAQVLPYALGCGDARGVGRELAYRPGLE